MSNCIKKLIFHLKLLNTGFVANDKWRQVPGFDMLHHIYFCLLRTTVVEWKVHSDYCRGSTVCSCFFRAGQLFGADLPKIGQCEHENR